jgi:FkbM family methyltransferase
MVAHLETGPMFAGGPTYQFQKFAPAFPYIRNFGHAVDAGAHCGLWTRVMAHCFGAVTASEPLPVHYDCLKRNTRGLRNVRLHQCALGAQPGAVNVAPVRDNTGAAAVSLHGRVEAKVATLDSFAVTELDFRKIDCEGFEYFVIQGAAKRSGGSNRRCWSSKSRTMPSAMACARPRRWSSWCPGAPGCALN